MRYASVCSGIEAASVAWEPLGWRASFLSEIEKFPRAVLAHRFPNVPLHGDFTTIQDGEYEPVDVLVGGTPCQSFSIAGLRGGLGDDRGNLALEYMRLAHRLRPRWLVWENVPGVLSSNGGRDFGTFLDMVESLGYIIDCDILDAQFHGVPQRRRRVFVCAQHRDFLLRNKTDSSALTIAQCLLEILHGILASQSAAFGSEPQNSDLAYLSSDGVMRRMRLFGLHGDHANFSLLQQNLAEACLRCHQEQRCSDASLGVSAKERTPEGQLKGLRMDDQSIPTVQQLNEALAESWEAMRSFTTSTGTNSTTQSEIFTFSKAALLIAQLIPHLNQSCPPFWSAASSGLIALEEFTNYARQASSDLFGDVERVPYWIHFIEQAESTIDALADIGIECFGEVFSIAESLRGDSPPRREKGGGVAALTANGVGTCGPDDNQAQAGHLIASTGDISHCLNAGGMRGQDYATETLIAHTLRGEGFDASEDGTGRGTPLVPVAIQERAICENPNAVPNGKGFRDDGLAYTLEARTVPQAVAFSCKDHGADAGDIAPTLRAMGHAGSHANAGGQVAVAFDLRGREGGSQFEGPHDTANIRAASGGSSRSYVAASAVRRLTPRECERLQGFPDDWTDVPYRGKPAADGPRYKAIGNSMAVPVMRWIGERIAIVERLT